MCNADLIGAGTGLVSSIGTGVGQIQSANAYNQYVSQQTASTMNNYEYQTRALNNRYMQEAEQIAQQKQATYLDNLQAKATATTSAAGSGVEGSSIDSLLTGYDRATAITNYMLDRQLRMKELQYSDQSEALRASALSSIYGQTPYNNTIWATAGKNISGSLTSFANILNTK